MGLFGKSSSKSGKFQFVLKVHELAPFPSRFASTSIIWNRGSKRGSLRGVKGSMLGNERGLARFVWNEDFEIDCTLSPDDSSPKPKDGIGYGKKWLILNIMDNMHPKAKEPLGRVVINLAEYANQGDPAPISFTVALSKALVAEVESSQLIVTIQVQEAGKNSARNGRPAYANSKASSEISDDVDSRSVSFSQSQQTGSLERIPEGTPQSRNSAYDDTPSYRSSKYDEDGFLIDDEPQGTRSSVKSSFASPQQTNRFPQAASSMASQANSDVDSEDEFLAQAVAAMEGKAPMPSLDQESRRNTRDIPRQPTSDLQPGFGSPQNSSYRPTQRTPAAAQDPPPRRPGAPLFALKPEGVPQDSSELSRRTSGAPLIQDSVTRTTRPKLASDVQLSLDNRSPGNSLDSVERPVLKTRQLNPPPVSEFPRTYNSSPVSSSNSEARTNPFLTDRLPPVTSSNPYKNSSTFSDRPVRKGSSTQSAQLQRLYSGSSSNAELPSEDIQRSQEVVIPSAVTLKRKPIVNVPVDPLYTSDSPVKANTGMHWLDEPEDLGVEDSPPESPVAAKRPAVTNDRPAFESVAPAYVPSASVRPEKAAPAPVAPRWASVADNKIKSPAKEQPSRPAPVSGDRRLSVENSHRQEQPPSPFGPEKPTVPEKPAIPEKPRSPTKRVLRPEQPAVVSLPPVTVATPQPLTTIPPRRIESKPEPPVMPPPKAAPPPTVVVPPPVAQPMPPVVQPQVPQQPASPKRGPPSVPATLPPGASFGAENRSERGSISNVAFSLPETADGARGKDNVGLSSSPPSNFSGQSQDGAVSLVESPDKEAANEEALRLMHELRSVAALEASIYMVRGLRHRKTRVSHKSRILHAPARRIARTIISLGEQEGVIFGLRALRAMEAAADGASDIPGQAYWWSNCIQLRWMLWAVCHGGDPEDDTAEMDSEFDEFQWVMQVLVPPLRALEAEIFQQLFQYMWSCVLMEGITAHQLPGNSKKTWSIEPNEQEEAVERWIEAFQTAYRALLPASNTVSDGHVNLLKHKILTALMKRLDTIFLDILLDGDSDSGTFHMGRRMIHKSWEGRKASGMGRELELGPDLLPFELGGPLSVGVGVALKMAATRWTTWAADIGLRNDQGSKEEGFMLFPKLRSTADLLMMPKEVLTDRAIRSEVIPGLQLSEICELLSRFRPDELSNQSLPPGLLEALHAETPTHEVPQSPSALGKAGYEPPSETALLASGLIDPVSLEFNDESEDELEALSEMFDPEQQGHASKRFQLLRDLWASAR